LHLSQGRLSSIVRFILLLVKPFHLITTVYDLWAGVSHEIFTLRELLGLLNFVHNFDRSYISMVYRINCKLNMVLHEEVHKSVLFLERQLTEDECLCFRACGSLPLVMHLRGDRNLTFLAPTVGILSILCHRFMQLKYNIFLLKDRLDKPKASSSQLRTRKRAKILVLRIIEK
jgi:hypothetical protein